MSRRSRNRTSTEAPGITSAPNPNAESTSPTTSLQIRLSRFARSIFDFHLFVLFTIDLWVPNHRRLFLQPSRSHYLFIVGLVLSLATSSETGERIMDASASAWIALVAFRFNRAMVALWPEGALSYHVVFVVLSAMGLDQTLQRSSPRVRLLNLFCISASFFVGAFKFTLPSLISDVRALRNGLNFLGLVVPLVIVSVEKGYRVSWRHLAWESFESNLRDSLTRIPRRLRLFLIIRFSWQMADLFWWTGFNPQKGYDPWPNGNPVATLLAAWTQKLPKNSRDLCRKSWKFLKRASRMWSDVDVTSKSMKSEFRFSPFRILVAVTKDSPLALMGVAACVILLSFYLRDVYLRRKERARQLWSERNSREAYRFREEQEGRELESERLLLRNRIDSTSRSSSGSSARRSEPPGPLLKSRATGLRSRRRQSGAAEKLSPTIKAATTEQLASLTKDDVCVVCQEGVADRSGGVSSGSSGSGVSYGVAISICVTTCDHVFHRLCLKQWVDEKETCPVCREFVSFRQAAAPVAAVAAALNTLPLQPLVLPAGRDGETLMIRFGPTGLQVVARRTDGGGISR